MRRLLACILISLIALAQAGAAEPQAQRERALAANAAYQAKDYATAFEMLDALAREDYAPAFPMLGHLYSNGFGVAQSKMLARHWYSKGAEHDDLVSLFNMGLYNDAGIGGPKDAPAALGYYRRAAELGDLQAAFNAGQMLITGAGVPVDFDAGVPLIRQAAEAGNARAQLTMGYMHEVGMGVPVSIAATERYYRAAKAGSEMSVEASSRLWDFEDRINERALALQENGEIGQAMSLFDQLCVAGDYEACYNSGLNWLQGRHGLKRDYRRAQEDFRSGCLLAYPNSCRGHAIATISMAAQPAQRDIDMARDYYELHCGYDEQDMCFNLAYMKYYARFGMEDYAGAKALLMTSCLEKGYQEACQPFYSIQNAETANRQAAAGTFDSSASGTVSDFLDFMIDLAGGMSHYGGGSYGGSYSGPGSGSGDSFASTNSAQDARNFDQFITSVNAIGTGYNSSCRSGNPYC